ncbi:MAG: hypothetical protein ACLPV8_22095 [Steroidobacteraceae bacterium]
MIGRSKAGVVIAGTIAAMAIGGVAFIGSGVNNIGADDHHTKIVLALVEQLRRRPQILNCPNNISRRK